jgi:hypothetical protein
MGIILQGKAEEAAMRSATTAVIPPIDTPERSERRALASRLGGVALASVVPAIFWCVVIELVSFGIGKPLSASTVGWVGAAIAFFLFVICAPLMLRSSASPTSEEAKRARRARAPDITARV